jgi:hypothetical protein
MKALLIALAICTLLLPARAQTNATFPFTAGVPTNLAHLIASTDHIVITNGFAAFVEKYRGFSLTISGDKARKIVQTVSSAKPCAPCDCIYSWDMKFYRETNFLAVIRFGGHFIFEKQEYYDESGVLERLDDELLKQTENK